MTVFEYVDGVGNDVVCHEVGHLLVGRALGFVRQAYIEFIPRGGRHKAVCSYSATEGPLGARVIRTLAGMSVQVKLRPTSIRSPLRERLAAGTLFAHPDINDASSDVRRALQDEGLDGDIYDDEREMGVLNFVGQQRGRI